jgi:RES domain-containing protein
LSRLAPSRYQLRLDRAMHRAASLATAKHLTLCRIVTYEFATQQDAVSGDGSMQFGQHWNPPGLRAVYGSLDPQTAFLECGYVRAFYNLPGASGELPNNLVILTLRAQLSRCVSFDEASFACHIGPSIVRRVKSEDWHKTNADGCTAVAQALGLSANRAGIQALIVPSWPNPGHQNCVIFPDQCPKGVIEILNCDQLPKRR